MNQVITEVQSSFVMPVQGTVKLLSLGAQKIPWELLPSAFGLKKQFPSHLQLLRSIVLTVLCTGMKLDTIEMEAIS